MHYPDGMVVIFRDEAQKARFATLFARPMVPTRYPDQSCMEALGIEPSIRVTSCVVDSSRLGTEFTKLTHMSWDRRLLYQWNLITDGSASVLRS